MRRDWLFTSKELDFDTGLYYYGARYYDPKTSVWQSPDPILASYMRGDPNNGVFSPRNLGLYTYVANNPVMAKDPDGRVYFLVVAAGVAWGILRSSGTPTMNPAPEGPSARVGEGTVLAPEPNVAAGAGRGGAKLKPNPEAQGPHTTFKSDPKEGTVTGHAEWDEMGNPVKRTDVTGSPHGSVGTPHTHEYGPPNVNP